MYAIKTEERYEGFSKDKKIFDFNNYAATILGKIEKSSKTRQEKKSLRSIFACFLTAIAKVPFLEGRLHPNLRFS